MAKIRCGWETAPTGPGDRERKSFLKLTLMVRFGMQIANVKQRQILPRMGKIWERTPQNRTYRFWDRRGWETSPMVIVGCLRTHNLVEFYLSVADCVELETFDGVTIIIKTGDSGRALIVGCVC